MNRRGFLKLFGAGLAIAAAPDPLRKYFFAPANGWKGPRIDFLPLSQWGRAVYLDEVALFGIPYHAGGGQWVGLNRPITVTVVTGLRHPEGY